MIRSRGFFAALIFSSLLVIPSVAHAANSEFRVLLDVDHDVASGCTISGMPGVDQVFTTRVTTTETAASVTRTVRQVCTMAGFGPIIDIETSGWPAGFQPASGNVTIETRIPFSAFASTSVPANMRVGVEGAQGAAVHTAILGPDGSIVVYPQPRRGKRRSVGSPGSPRVMVLDGLENDWTGLGPLFQGIAAGGSPSLRIIKVTAFSDNANDQLYFLFNAFLSSDAPFADDDEFPRPAGAGLAIPAPGVLDGDVDPSGLPLTATPVSPATHGSVTLNPDGSFTYTPNDPSSTETDTFEYKASNGTKESNTATVTIPVESAGNDNPIITSSSTRDVPENTTSAGALTATDADGDTLTFSISGGADSGHFSIVGGNLVFNSAPDFEVPTDADGNNQYLVQVTVSDGNGGTDVQVITVTVTNGNEPPNFTSGGAGDPVIPENTTEVMTVTASDPDGDDLTFSIVSGGDGADFDIDSDTGVLTFDTAPNFEAPADANSDNQYTVTVRATDGANPITMTITVTVTDVNEPPAFMSPNAPNVPENTTAVLTVTADDPEGSAITYSLTGGADQAFFSINATTGALTFITGRDFEAPADANANNQYLVQVTASDGTNNVVQSIAVTVTGVDEAPVVTSANSASVPENTTAVLTVTADDPEAAALAFSISGGADAADFSINATTGVLTFNAAPNFEAPADADANNQYLVQVTVDDGTNSVNQIITVTVTDQNDAPVVTSTNSTTVPENTVAVLTVTATDEDGNALTYSITGGADAALFSINSTTGALTFNAAPNFEAPADAGGNNVYDVQVTANDGTTGTAQNVAITVTDADEAPTVTSSNSANVPENTTAVLTVTGNDPEAATLTFSISGGADAALFSINATTGVLTFNAAPNFEAPADADTNNQYLVQVTVDDGANSVNQTITVTVTNQNDAPVAPGTTIATVAENTVVVLSVTFTDEDGDTLTYSISGGADAALFSINSSTGELTFNSAPDFEAPADADADNQYLVQVTANDGTTGTAHNVTITVTDVDEAPAFTSSSSASVAENTTTAVMTVTASDPEGSALTYSISGGADAALFSINASTGALTFNALPNFEAPADADANNQYLVQVTATDGTNTANQTITVTVTNQNDAPGITSGTAFPVAENTTAVATVTGTDDDGNALTFSIGGGADAALFSINSATGVLSFNAAPNFEAPADAGADNVYNVQVTVNDGTTSVNQPIAVTVTDVNEAPAFTSSNAASVAENTTAIMTVTAVDPEAAAVTYSLTGGADQAFFSIHTNTGALTFTSGRNFETPADADANNTYIVQVTANDGTNNSAQTITVTVTNANEPTVITSSNTATIPENTLTALTVTATDPEGAPITFSLTGGADQALFSIDGSTGVLTFNAPPDFENPADADADNQYVVQVTASDGTNDTNQTLTITGTDDDEAPSITSSNTASVVENTTAVLTATATDPEVNTITWSITGGADAADFSIDTNTGALTFSSAPDFEAPADADTDNSYIVEVTANDGTNNTAQTITVTVTDDNESPSITSSNAFSVAENSTAVSTLTTSDPENDTITWSISGGADSALFSINTSTGALAFLAAPNFESPADADTNNDYVVQVTATDGEFPVNQTITVTVTDVNEAPSITSSNTASVAENTTAVTTVTTTDPEGNTVTYSITGGADSALFAIDTNTGALTFNAAPDFEAPGDADTNNSYIVQVTANDGTNNTAQTITVTVTDVNEAPAITSSASPSVAENTTAVLTVTSTDPEGNTVTYSITGGADAALFGIVSGTGVLTFNSAPNFESPGDADTNNTYIVEVTANDGTNNTPQTITVTVTDVNEGPSITSANTASVAENTTAVTTVTTTDPETDTITYSVSGGADAALFSIDSNTGALTFNAGPNFEVPGDADTDNDYVVEVSATDGTTPATQTITVTVTNVNEAPSVTSSATPSTVENTTSAVTVTATDPENDTLTYSITGGADQALFSIDTNTGVLTFLSAPDFEAPGDAGANNVYDVQVTVTDGSFPVAQNIAVTVTDANEAPSFTSANTNSVPENTLTAHTVTTSDPESDTITYSVTGGADQADFSIDSNTGVLSFLVNPNFEAPHDADTNNTYVVQVTATDGTNPISQTITITVTNVNEAPAFTSPNTANVPENTTAVHTVTTTDPEGNTVLYSVSGGADMLKFAIDANSGALSFILAPDFENPLDADADNVYVVEVTANDGTNSAVQTISVTVINGNEAPVFTSSATPSVAENQTAVVTVTTTDVENDPRTYTITGGADAALFSIDLNSGALTFDSAPNFELPGDVGANNIYDVQVTANDGALDTVQNLVVTVTNVNEAPIYSSSDTVSLAENIAAVTTVVASDPEATPVLYSVTGGADQAKFSIVAATGALSFITPPNFDIAGDADADNVYEVEVTATDGVNPVVQSITVTITNVDEAATFSSSATPSVPENMTAVTTVAASDPEGGALTYSIVGGVDQALFAIDTNSGALTFLSAPNFEAPLDTDTNNIYLVNIEATDGVAPVTQNLTVTVTNVNEAPSFTSVNTANTAENTTAVIDVDATDPDAATTLTYSIVGGADQAKFSIVSGTGVLTFLSAPDFETPTDAGANNIYDVDVEVTDGVNPVTQSIAVTVTNVDEAPAFSSANTANVNENTTAVVDVDATDPEGAAVTYSIVGGADQGDFSIDSDSGVLTFNPAPNFEGPADADTNNVYIVQVQASAGAVPATQTITVTVINVNEAPVNTVPAGTQTTNEDTNFTFAGTISVSDPDAGSNPVQVTLTATHGTITIPVTTGLSFTTGDGTDDPTLVFTGTIANINTRLNGMFYKPTPNYYGTGVNAGSLTILTNDQGNTGSGGAQSSNGGVPNSITINITPVNDPPVAVNLTHITHSGIGLSINVGHNDDLKEDATDVDDHDPFSELTVQLVGGSVTPSNATVTLTHVDQATMGAFYFEPPGGIGADDTAPTFQYQVCDNGDVGLGLAPQCSAPATVTVNLTGADTWFVDDTDAAGCGVTCNGARTKPLVGLNHATLATRGTGDRVFAFSGTYNHGFTMTPSELLVGQASSGAFDAVLGVSIPGNGTLDTRPTLSGAAATLQNTLTAANSTTVRGMTISSGANKGYVANANTLTVLESSVSAGNTAVEITNGTSSNVAFTSTTSTAGTHGINLGNVSGTFAFGSGGLSNNTTAGFALSQNAANVANVTFSGNINTTAAGRPIDIGTGAASSGMRGGTIGLSGNIGNVSANSAGIRVRNSTAGTLNLSGAIHALTTGANNAIELTTNPGATFNFNPGTSLVINTTTGRGFLGSGGGTINVTGANNTITTTNGGAFEVFGTNLVHMGGGYTWKSISATNGTDGISLQFHDGPFSVSGDGADGDSLPDSVTAGGTITGADQRGAELVDVDGPVSLNGMTFTNSADTAGPDATVATGTCGSAASGGSNTGCFAGIHFDTVSNVSLDTVTVNGSGQMGINGNAVTNLTMSTISILNAGTSAQEDGLRMYNLGGTGGITGLTIDNPFAMGIKLQNTTATLATEASPFLITNATITDSSAAQGAVLHTVSSGNAFVKFVNGTISGHFSVGIQTASDVGATGTLGVYVDGTSFSNVAGAVHLQASGGTQKFDIRNINMVARASGSSHSIMLKGDSTGILTGKVYSNTIGNATAYSGAPAGSYPISVDARNTSTITAEIRGNTFRHADAGVEVGGGQGSSKVNLTVTGNRILDPEAATALAGIYANSGILNADSSCMTMQIGGLTAYPGSPSATESDIKNQIEGNWPSASIRVIKSFGGSPPDPVFNLPGYDGSGVNAWIAARNTFVSPGTTVSNNAGAGGAFTSAASCP
jgi:VCBS repeat-containing protein